MATNTANQITILTALQTLITTIEADASNWRCGDAYIDSVSQALLTTKLDGVMTVLLNNGSRAQQAATSQMRAVSNNAGAGVSADITYELVDNFMRNLATQIAILQNPAQTPRRVHTAGQ